MDGQDRKPGREGGRNVSGRCGECTCRTLLNEAMHVMSEKEDLLFIYFHSPSPPPSLFLSTIKLLGQFLSCHH